jgi:hypothetical protein
VQVAQHGCHKDIDSPKKVALRDHVIEPEFVKKARLVSIPSPHHRRILPIPFDQESSFGDSLKYFFDSIDPEQA